MAILEVELPAVYLDAVLEDAVPAVAGATPTLINLDPEANEVRVDATTNISLDIATLDSVGTISLPDTKVYVNGVLAFDAGTFQAGFDGPESAYSNPQADVLRVIIDPTDDFTSEERVTVRVVSASGSAGLDTSYIFTTADTLPPTLVSAVARDLMRVRVRFDDDVNQDAATSAISALNPENWQLDRLGDYLDPLVSATVVAVESVTTTEVDLITNIPLTPGGHYRVTALDQAEILVDETGEEIVDETGDPIVDAPAGGIQDTDGNTVQAPLNTADFLGWQPPVPEGRDFDLYRKLPLLNQQEDATQDLYRFIACLQEVAGLLLWDIDRFIEILDPDTAPEAFVDAMLADLGNPFDFELSVDDKRRLAQILVDIYRLKGTRVGIINVIRFFMGLEVTVDEFNLIGGVWLLGDSELGEDTFLGTSIPYSIYSFTVTIAQVLTATQRKQLTEIVEYMKPAHTHFVKLIEPTIPEVIDHLELGLSELGENWTLH